MAKDTKGTPVKQGDMKEIKATEANKFMDPEKVYKVHATVAARLVKAKKAVYVDGGDIV